MSSILLVIVTGAPATGKTALGKRIAEELQLPFMNKDGIKETLFDSLGWKDREWSKRLGAASMDLLFLFAEGQLRAGRSCVVESNFYPEFDTERFLDLARKCPYKPFQVLCTTDAETLAGRYRGRAESGERHPGHVDHMLFKELDVKALQSKHGALEIGGQVVRVDTTDPKAIDYKGLFRAITTEAVR